VVRHIQGSAGRWAGLGGDGERGRGCGRGRGRGGRCLLGDGVGPLGEAAVDEAGGGGPSDCRHEGAHGRLREGDTEAPDEVLA